MSDIYKRYNPGNSDNLYLKILDGDKIKLRIMSEPAVSVYQKGAKPRYSWIVLNHDLGRVQILTKGISVYRQIAALAEDWGSPNDFDIRVSRTGSGLQDTEYTVVPIKQSTEPTKTQTEEADKIDLLSAIKGKWLKDYADDGILPDPVVAGAPTQPKKEEPIEIEELDKVDLDEMPPEFLKQ